MTPFPSEWMELRAYERDALLAIASDPGLSGTEVHQTVRTDDCRPTSATVYPVLEDLQEAGLARKQTAEDSGRRREWYLTDRGELLVGRVTDWMGDI